VNGGEIFGFLGPNGAGKSTTIKMVTGILQPDHGDIVLNDISFKQDPYAYKHNFGYVPDNHSCYDKLSGMEYLNFMGSLYGVNTADLKARAENLLEKFNLTSAVNDQIKTYSHGMKQKIVVIGALLHKPKLWILDEPLTGLDPQSAFELKQMMREHADEGNIVFFSSHVIEVVEKLADRVAIINNGKLAALGTLDELKKDRNISLEELFLQTTKRGEV
jgi:ABC-2 type transport system ATP-binding protein